MEIHISYLHAAANLTAAANLNNMCLGLWDSPKIATSER